METFSTAILICLLIFAAATLYSSVGHGGASGYLAVLALFSFAPATMRPTVLILNICVSLIAAVRFARSGYFRWRKFYPFALGSIPLAFLGGSLGLPNAAFKTAVGAILLVAAFLLWRRESAVDNRPGTQAETVPFAAALLCGAALGLLSGLTGVGGGIFLSPVLLFLGWADVKQTAAISAVFILVNSLVGLAANLNVNSKAELPEYSTLFLWAGAAIAGGILGASWGANRRSGNLVLRRILAIVLLVAGLKMIFA